jgi:hypothetical protein
MTNTRKMGVLLGVFMSITACADLDTDNLNAPDADRALSQAGDVEALIGSSWLTWYNNHHALTPGMALSTAADEGTGSWGNFGMQQISSEPRASFPNSTGFSYRSVAETPWFGMYGAISSVNDGLKGIAGGMKFGTNGADTDRAQTFAKFVQGLAHAWLGLQFDQAFVFTEDIDLDPAALPDMKNYKEVMAAAIAMLDQAAQLAQSKTFTTPDNWIIGSGTSSANLARVAKSYTARYIAAVARTPEERAAVNWQDVLNRANAGITTDFGPTLDNTRIRDQYKDYHQRFDWVRTDLKLLGPADISGKYQAWLATPVADRQPFTITTPDRRVTGATPTSSGTDFYYRATQNHPADRGTYHWSNYGNLRYLTIRQTQIGFSPILTLVEMDLLRAEAYIRLNQPAQAAALINKTRTTRGQLPAVTAQGVPAGTDCVPRTITGACGSLMDALMYEKRIETYAIAAGLAYSDARGWGILVPGTAYHYPVPARELETLGMESYTFGGVGGSGAAK